MALCANRFRAVFNQTYQCLGLLSVDGTLLEANRSALAFAGIQAQDAVGKPIWETPFWTHSPQLQAQLRDAVHTAAAGEIVQFEATHPRADGELRHIHFSLKPVRDRQGKVTFLIPEGRDVSERIAAERLVVEKDAAAKKAETALHESETRNRAILRALPDLMFRMNQDGTILDFYAADAGELYVSPGVFLGQRMWDVLPHELGRRFYEHHRESLASRQSQVFEYDLDIPRRGTQSFEARIVASGERETVTIIRNTTERRILESRLRRIQTMDTVGQLASGMAHDFNNLLTVINSYSELIRDALPADHLTRPMVEQIFSAGERAAFLARQLLALGGRSTQEQKVVDVTAVIDDIRELIGRVIGKHIELSLESDSEPCLVQADARQLQQVAINLILNARDAMPDGGRLRILTANVELPSDNVKPDSDIRAGRFVRISVHDTGCGMSPSIQDRIFEPFFTTKEPGKGTGLGLSVVEGIVKQHGGFIGFDSAPDQGTQFDIYLPAARERHER